jgi:hypothetical protein
MPLQIDCLGSYFHFYAFNVKYVKSRLVDVKKVMYYICPWHFHVLPNKDEFAAEGIECEIISLPHFDTEKLLETLQETEAAHQVPTLAIVQRILPFQREAWKV